MISDPTTFIIDTLHIRNYSNPNHSLRGKPILKHSLSHALLLSDLQIDCFYLYKHFNLGIPCIQYWASWKANVKKCEICTDQNNAGK